MATKIDPKRGTPSIGTEELVLITDKRDPLYDGRVFDPIPDEHILSMAIVGQQQPIALRQRPSGDIIVVDGIQRTKRVLAINHLVGFRSYDGDLKPVRDAIKRLTGSDLQKRLLEHVSMTHGMRLSFVVQRGTESRAYLGKAAANSARHGDDKAAWIAKAQQMHAHNITVPEIAVACGVGEATISKWLKVDLDKPKAPKKERSTVRRPGAKKILAARHADINTGNIELLRWVLGEISDADISKLLPALHYVLFPPKIKQAA